MISSSNRSVMVSKSANVSIWKEREEMDIEGAVAQGQALHKPIFLHQASRYILGACPCFTSGYKSGFNIKKSNPQLGLSGLDYGFPLPRGDNRAHPLKKGCED